MRGFFEIESHALPRSDRPWLLRIVALVEDLALFVDEKVDRWQPD